MVTYPTRRATSAGGVVLDEPDDDRCRVLLIARRSALGKVQWTLPKGRLEPGESSEEAALREVREETGHGCVIIEPLDTIEYWFVWHEDEVRYHKFVHYFLMRWDGEQLGDRDDEAEHVEWVPVETALVRLAHRNERKLVAEAADRHRAQG